MDSEIEQRFEGLEDDLSRVHKQLDIVEQSLAISISMYIEIYASVEALLKYIDKTTNSAEFSELLKAYEKIRQQVWSSLADQVPNVSDESRAALENILKGNKASDPG